MLISEKQQQANQQNAQHSTGPKTAAGKAAVRLNALKYGLRARDLLLPNEDPAEYQQLWDDLETEWKPQTRSERTYLVQMATSEWLLARLARGENLIYQADLPLKNNSRCSAKSPPSAPGWSDPTPPPSTNYSNCKRTAKPTLSRNKLPNRACRQASHLSNRNRS